MSVLLLNMPFANLSWPNLGLSLMKSALASRGMACDLASPCFDFAERVGLDLYSWIADNFAFVLGGEYLFAKDFFGDRIPPIDAFWKNVVLWTETLTEEDFRDFRFVGDAVTPFLDEYCDSISWQRYRIVGFTVSYQQTLASLALARRIKARHPGITIVFGGAACESSMGGALFRFFPEIDAVFLGEADETFPQVVARLLDTDAAKSQTAKPFVAEPSVALPFAALPSGVLLRTAETQWAPELPLRNSCSDADRPDLDRLPFPDFDDYFARLAASPLRTEIDPLLFFETSRGCWWGQHRQCAFCGLNGSSLNYRHKNPARAVEELSYLVRRHGIDKAAASDNIFAKDYFDTFLPMLTASGLGLRFEYEMKANLTKAQCRKLVDAGLAAAQLGIETFSTPLLKLLGKGALARHNLQVLKWFTAAGIDAKWNFLYGFPGEDPVEYVRLAELIPKLVHLVPPLAVGRVRADRFGPYHNDPEKFGIRDVHPHRSFRYIYPFDDAALRSLAYFHEFDFPDGRDPNAYAAPALEQVAPWQTHSGHYTFHAFDREDGVLLLTDTRPCATRFQWRFSGRERRLYLECDTARDFTFLTERFPESNADDLRTTLDRWVDANLMLFVDERYFSLATFWPDE